MDLSFFSASRLARLGRLLLIGVVASLLLACGGGDDASDDPTDAPTITAQPDDVTVTAGQGAIFSVDADGGGLHYQWQRDGVDIDGETGSTLVLPATSADDDGATFDVVVTNDVGSVTSDDAVLTVITPTPVLTITRQPVDATASAGTVVTFTVDATCSSGALDVQWQRNGGANGAFVDLAGATSASLALTPSVADSGAQFRAALDCDDEAGTTSGVATLTVSAPAGVRVDPLTVTGLRVQGMMNFAGPVAVRPDGSVVFATSNLVKRVSADLSSILRLAGSGNSAIVDGVGAAASFSQLQGAAADGSGNVYVSDNSTIRRVAADGTVTTVAGTGSSGFVDGTGAAARFGAPHGIAFGPDGDLYVADATAHSIRRVNVTTGAVTTYAGGTGQAGYVDGAAGSAQFNVPWAVAVAANGDVYVADLGNNRIRRVARSGNGAGTVSTFAGSGTTGFGTDGVGSAAVIDQPIALSIRGNLLTVLQATSVVRQVDLTTAAVTTFAGTYTAFPTGFGDGPRGKALFTGSGAIAQLADGRFIVGDRTALRLIATNGDVRTIAVTGADETFAAEGGMLATHPFEFASNTRQSLTVDPSGQVVVASGSEVRRISAAGSVSLVAGVTDGILGMIDGVGTVAQFSAVGSGIAAGPDGALYVSDAESLRRIDPTSGQATLLAGYRVLFADTSGNSPYGAVDGDAATARFQNTLRLAVGPDGALYVADAANFAIRRVDASGNTTTWAGALGLAGTVNGARTASRFRAPVSIAFTPDGTLYVVDNGDLRKVSADGTTVSTVSSGSFGQVVADAAGNLFLSAVDGLYEIAAGTATPVRLVAGGANDEQVTGDSPHLGRVDSLAVLAPGQLVMISGGQLVKVTLP